MDDWTRTIYRLSGSTSGRPISVSATSSPGTLIHLPVLGTRHYDEMELWAQNVANSVVELTLQFGGVSTSDDMVFMVPSKARPMKLLDGQRIHNGSTIKAFADQADKILITGNVIRYEK